MEARDSTNFDEELLAVVAQTIQRLGGSVPAAPKSSNYSERLLQLLRVLSPLLTGESMGNRVDSWGEIVGTLSDQVDLWEALGDKVSQTQLSAAIAPLADKVSLTTIQNIQARHVFSPSTVGPPFNLGANAVGRQVAGFNADQVDGVEAAALLDRANHTNTQAIATIAGLQAALDGKQPLAALLTAIAGLATPGLIENTGAEMAVQSFLLSSNANGNILRLGSLQVCWRLSLTLTYVSAAVLSGTWTYPAAFSSTPAVFAFLRNATSGATPAITQVTQLYCSSLASTSTNIRIQRTGVDFQTGDALTVAALAVGPWS